MKKLLGEHSFRKLHGRRSRRANLRLTRANRLRIFSAKQGKVRVSPRFRTPKKRKPIVAPSDLRLIENPEATLRFIRDLRHDSNLIKGKDDQYVSMSLRRVKKIDYGTITVLTALNDHFWWKKVIMRSTLPTDQHCNQFMVDAGYLNNLFDSYGRRFKPAEKSEVIFFEKGKGKLTEEHIEKISDLVLNVIQHFGGSEEYLLPLKTVILEICGNSIEWSGTGSKQWLLGAVYEKDHVIFTATDVGKGILNTLHDQYKSQILELFGWRDGASILKRAFEKKYGSSSREANRNKGLPAIKHRADAGILGELKVLTNEVLLDFHDDTRTKTFRDVKFKGTFYQWVMYSDCLRKLVGENV